MSQATANDVAQWFTVVLTGLLAASLTAVIRQEPNWSKLPDSAEWDLDWRKEKFGAELRNSAADRALAWRRKKVRDLATSEARTAVEVATELRALGLPIKIVSVAGTPSAPYAAAVEGVTEVRPGTYVFYDANYLRCGVCTLPECALTVRTTVVSRPAADRVVIDAGTKVLSGDRGAVTDGRGTGYYGLILEAPDSYIDLVWEEHAVVRLDERGRSLSVGDIVHIVPFHVCPVVNLADNLIGLHGDFVQSILNVDARGCSS
jgi:D-serine deaminase-like pyridoxal phosphate-dependent protein